MSVDLMRVDACPRCGRGFPDADPAEESIGCPVCKGRPVRVLVLWNRELDILRDARDPASGGKIDGSHVRPLMAGAAAIAAADIAERPASVCGRLLKPLLLAGVPEFLMELAGFLRRNDLGTPAAKDGEQAIRERLAELLARRGP